MDIFIEMVKNVTGALGEMILYAQVARPHKSFEFTLFVTLASWDAKKLRFCGAPQLKRYVHRKMKLHRRNYKWTIFT